MFHSFFNRFFNAPLSPIPLGIFRILIAAFMLLQAGLWYPDWIDFFAQEGWIQWEISKADNMPWELHLQDLYHWLSPLGVTADQMPMLFFGAYVVCAFGLLLGWYTRIWAILCYLLHYVIMGTIPMFTYGVDIFLHISLFYIMLMPVGKAFSLDTFLGRLTTDPHWSVTLSIRVLQLHLCLVYFSAGYEKMLAPEWWDGNVIWRALVQPSFNQFELTWLAWTPVIPMVLGWFTMIVEVGYVVGMWIRKVRVFWLAGIVSLHLGIMLFLGLYCFGLIMIILSVSAFGYPAWLDIKNWSRQKTEVPNQQGMFAALALPKD